MLFRSLTVLLTPEQTTGRRVLLLLRDDIPQNERLPKHLAKVGALVTKSEVPGYAAMMRDTFDAVVPDAALTKIREWLEDRYPLDGHLGSALVPAEGDGGFLTAPDGAGESVRETPVRFGPHGNLFGMLTTPVVPQAQEDGRASCRERVSYHV